MKFVIFKSTYCTSSYNAFTKCAITSSSALTARLGRTILEQGGSIADCAITVLLSSGVRNPERMGIGGGFILSYYDNKTKKIECLLAREQAPGKSTKYMFRDRVGAAKSEEASIFGGLAVAVPGSLKGYWELHKRYGRLPWKYLVEPAIELCRNGVYVSPFTRYGLKQVEQDILHSNTLRQLVVDPFTGTLKTQNHKIYRHALAKTLEKIAENGPDILYNGELTKNFVNDIQSEGGIITVSDMANYRCRWLEPVKLKITNDLLIHSPPSPSSGPVLLLILNVISKYKNFKSLPLIDRWFCIVEAWKHAYGYRTRIGDPLFERNSNHIVAEMLNEATAKIICNKIDEVQKHSRQDVQFYGGDYEMSQDSGTAHFNFIAPNGDAIAVTETLNNLFGAMFRSVSTGIILNNTMGDFSIPGIKSIFAVPPFAHANYIKPGKVPLTSMVPSIITDQNLNIRMLIGGAGGTRIVTAVSIVLIHHLLLNVEINEAIDMDRIHHQLLPMLLNYETNFPEDIVLGLRSQGHEIVRIPSKSVISAILKNPSNNLLYAKCDLRRYCAISGF